MFRRKEVSGEQMRMNGKLPGGLGQMISFGLAVLFMGIGSLEVQRAAPLAENISLDCGESGITAEELSWIREQEQDKEDGMEFTAWTQRRQVCITDADRVRSTYVEALEINGSSELLLPYGKILHEDDMEGCILGEGTAWELFGSRNVEGLTLCYGERELTIRGVLHTPEHLIMVETDEGTDRFQRITLKTQEGISRKMSAERLAGSYGLDATQICFTLLSEERLLELIPGKWSDFSGWGENVSALWQDAVFLISVEKSSLELVWLSLWGKALLWIAAGILFFFWGWKGRCEKIGGDCKSFRYLR